jgi:hypothetical protein
MKSRDLIPGWPRGRSTSRPYESEQPPAMFGGSDVGSVLDYSATETVFGVDHRWKQDWAAKEIERRRKADMMEAFWLEQRVTARRKLRPEMLNERLLAANWKTPVITLHRYHVLGPLGCGCCPGGKHQW